MSKFKSFIRQNFRMLAFVFLPLIAFCMILEKTNSFNGGFGPVLGGLLSMFAIIVFFGGMIVSLLMGKDKIFKTLALILLGYVVYRLFFEIGNYPAYWVKNQATEPILYSVFSFIYIIAFVVFVSLFFIHAFLNKDFGKVLLILGLVVLGLGLLAMVFEIVLYAKYESDWTTYFTAICEHVFLIPFVYCCFINYIYEDKCEVKEIEKPVQQEENKEEIVKEDDDEEIVQD